MRPLDATEAVIGSGSRPPVAFDLGGVLLRGGVLAAGTETAAFEVLEARFGIPAPEAERIWGELLAPSETGAIPESAVWEALAGGVAGPADIRAAILDMASPVDEAVEALSRLKAAGCRTALGSNHLLGWIDEWRSRFPWFALLDVVVVSAAIGVRKPDPAFFHRLRSELAMAGERPWFIDDRQANVDAAAMAGFRCIWVDAHGQWQVDGP